jgi:hypothetical protein
MAFWQRHESAPEEDEGVRDFFQLIYGLTAEEAAELLTASALAEHASEPAKPDWFQGCRPATLDEQSDDYGHAAYPPGADVNRYGARR